MSKRRTEAYAEVDESTDEVFQTYLYDWYIQQGWSERLLEVGSDHVVKYLQRRSETDLAHADLLWRYFARHSQFLDAAKVQLTLAESEKLVINLSSRIEYLSRAKANASTRTNGLQDFGRSRQPRQEVVRRINDLLDLANIQQDILHRLLNDSRVTAEKRPELEKELDGKILPLDDLYNQYADQASYYDLCLIIYDMADYRNAADIAATWANLINTVDKTARDAKDATPFQAVASEVQTLGRRLNCSDTTFPIRKLFSLPISNRLLIDKAILLPVLLEYAFKDANEPARATLASFTWPIDLLLDLSVAHETLVTVLEDLFYSPEALWTKEKTKSRIAQLLVYTIDAWFDSTARGQGVVFGGDENTIKMLELVKEVIAFRNLGREGKEEAERVREKIERVLW
jgi:nuclear pore complex protein Nup155